MKKMINVVLAALIVLAMTACGNKDQVGEASPPAQTPEAVVAAQNTAGVSDSKADAAMSDAGKTDSDGTGNLNSNAADSADSKGTETDSEDAALSSENSDDDYQNPTMNFIGPYVADSAEMEVSASGKSDAVFKVTWDTGDSTGSVWSMSGELNADTFTVEYADCEKKDYVYNEDGSVESETVAYNDGTGRIIFNPQDGTLVWEDEKEHAADALIFEYSYSVAEAAETGELG